MGEGLPVTSSALGREGAPPGPAQAPRRGDAVREGLPKAGPLPAHVGPRRPPAPCLGHCPYPAGRVLWVTEVGTLTQDPRSCQVRAPTSLPAQVPCGSPTAPWGWEVLAAHPFLGSPGPGRGGGSLGPWTEGEAGPPARQAPGCPPAPACFPGLWFEMSPELQTNKHAEDRDVCWSRPVSWTQR